MEPKKGCRFVRSFKCSSIRGPSIICLLYRRVVSTSLLGGEWNSSVTINRHTCSINQSNCEGSSLSGPVYLHFQEISIEIQRFNSKQSYQQIGHQKRVLVINWFLEEQQQQHHHHPLDSQEPCFTIYSFIIPQLLFFPDSIPKIPPLPSPKTNDPIPQIERRRKVIQVYCGASTTPLGQRVRLFIFAIQLPRAAEAIRNITPLFAAKIIPQFMGP